MRIRKLIDPSLQLKLTTWFLATTAVGLLFQFLLITNQLSVLALDLPGEPTKNYEALARATRNTFFLSMLVILPLTLGVGILTTFKFVGPVYRFKEFLTRIANGEKPADCVIRKGDEMQDFCRLLNEATAPMRRSAEDGDGDGEESHRTAA